MCLFVHISVSLSLIGSKSDDDPTIKSTFSQVNEQLKELISISYYMSVVIVINTTKPAMEHWCY